MPRRERSKRCAGAAGRAWEAAPGPWALAFRALSLVIVLTQLALPLFKLSSPALCAFILLASAIAAYALERLKIRYAVCFLACAAFPFLLRAAAFLFLGIRSLAAPGPGSDALFLLFDQSFFPAYLPAAWMGVSSVLASRNLKFLRLEPAGNAILFFAAFWSESGFKLVKYSHPSLLALAAGAFILCEAARLTFAERSAPRETRRKALLLPLAVLPMMALLFLFLLGRYSDQATASGGGLIKPTLSRFDFSRYLKLESEISLSKDLVLLVKKDSQDPNIFLRRHILAGYDKKKGFFMDSKPWVEDLPSALPGRAAEYDAGGWKGRGELEQEYYIVNFDPGSFIAMNAPISSVPLGNWDKSSFKSIYRAVSSVPGPEAYAALPDAYGSAEIPADGPPGMRGQAYAYYTDYGKDEKIAELARTATRGESDYYARAVAVEQYLRTEYRYSLKPGVAEDGDQLHHFLFVGKKGYCSYFAFSMTLMLRSLGIPARVAVGFFIDPNTNVLSLYPVRADMAHAWVEAFFPGYGWVDFDPTSQTMAKGENLEFGDDIDSGQYVRLIQEILMNRDRLKPTERPESPQSMASRVLGKTGEILKQAVARWYLTLPGLLALSLLARRLARALPPLFAGGFRRKALRLFDRAMLGRADSGFRRRRDESRQEYCAALDGFCGGGDGHLRASLLRDRALYGPEFGREEFASFRAALAAADAAFAARLGRAGRIAAFLFLPSLKRPRKRGAAALLMVLLAAAALSAQGEAKPAASPAFGAASAADLMAQAERSMAAENFDAAAGLLKSGEAGYPDRADFPRKLGYLYYDKELYSLAIGEFKRAEKLSPEDSAMIYTMSDVLGRLNREKESIAYLKRTLDLDPGNKDAVSDLGWMYFKVHQTDNGIALLEKASKDFGYDKSFEMTLGTLYSDRYDYAEAKKHYLASIDSALKSGAPNFAGVAYYNLSILESKYYNFPEAVKLTEKSIEYYDRASAHLARGELAQKSLDLAKARSEYEIAYAYDTSPLSSLSLADVALDSGRPEKARRICEEILKRSDHSWMLNFGTDLESHTMDVYDILYKAYAGLARTAWRRPVSGPIDAASAWLQSAECSLRAWYCRERYRKLSYAVSRSYRREGNALLAEMNCYNALEGYPDRALAYLDRARAYETALVPACQPSFQMERAILLKDLPAALKAANALLQPWEGDILVDGLARAGRIMKARGMGGELRALEERLFSLNRGGVLQAGLSLPLALETRADTAKAGRAMSGALVPALRRAGLDFRAGAKASDCRYRLSLSVSGGNLEASLTETRSARNVAYVSEPLGKADGKALRALEEKILAAVFDTQAD